VQLSDLHRKTICQLADEHKSLSQDKLNALLQTPLNKPELARSTVTGILKERTKWLASFVEETIKAPSCVMQGSSSKAWQCSWLTDLNFQLR